MTAEQLRRSGNPAAAADLCRDALARFPGYLSARVTLGWALLDLGRLKEAREEFETVHRVAPDNFAAIRGLAQLHVLEETETEAYGLALAADSPASTGTEAASPAGGDTPDSTAATVVRLESWLARVETLKNAV